MIRNKFLLVYKENLDESLNSKLVLCLENFYFHIFKIRVENVINEEDRILKIEEHLEIIFPKYNSTDFILNYEFLEKNSEDEYLIIYLLNLIYLRNENIVIDDSKYQLLSIIPSFFKVREFKDKANFYNFDLSSRALIISKYVSDSLQDINSFYMDSSIDTENQKINYFNLINTFLSNIEEDYSIIFTGNKIDIQKLYLENKDYMFFNTDEIDFRKYPNFLPKKIQRRNFIYFLNFKYLIITLFLIIISFFACAFLYYKINISERELQNLESKTSLLEEENKNIREELKDLENNRIALENEKNKISKPSFKISLFLTELRHILPENIKISAIEYDGVNTLSLVGICSDLNYIILFLENIQHSKNLKLNNYDYIIKKDSNIEFKFELTF